MEICLLGKHATSSFLYKQFDNRTFGYHILFVFIGTWTCPTGWESHGKQCYKMSHQVSNFSNAQKYCHDQKAEVIMPKTEAENEIAKKLLDQ